MKQIMASYYGIISVSPYKIQMVCFTCMKNENHYDIHLTATFQDNLGNPVDE